MSSWSTFYVHRVHHFAISDQLGKIHTYVGLYFRDFLLYHLLEFSKTPPLPLKLPFLADFVDKPQPVHVS